MTDTGGVAGSGHVVRPSPVPRSTGGAAGTGHVVRPSPVPRTTRTSTPKTRTTLPTPTPAPRAPGHRGRLVRGVGSLVVAALGVGLAIGGGALGGTDADAGPDTAAGTRPALGLAQPAAAASPAVTLGTVGAAAPLASVRNEVAPPVSIAIPDLGIDQNLIGLRVDRAGTLEAPAEYLDIGWWGTGPAPGEPGGAVLAGHVNGNNLPGVFAELDRLADGAEVVVDRSDGSTATYRVTGRQQFPKDDFPDDLVYSLDGPTTLHLVTCGGEFDPVTGSYYDNVVVFAELVSDTRRIPTA